MYEPEYNEEQVPFAAVSERRTCQIARAMTSLGVLRCSEVSDKLRVRYPDNSFCTQNEQGCICFRSFTSLTTRNRNFHDSVGQRRLDCSAPGGTDLFLVSLLEPLCRGVLLIRRLSSNCAWFGPNAIMPGHTACLDGLYAVGCRHDQVTVCHPLIKIESHDSI